LRFLGFDYQPFTAMQQAYCAVHARTKLMHGNARPSGASAAVLNCPALMLASGAPFR
jgi:hypothetical protein